MNAPHPAASLTRNVTRISRLDLPGAGQVYVQGNYAYIGHLPNKQNLGTTIVDVSDPRRPGCPRSPTGPSARRASGP